MYAEVFKMTLNKKLLKNIITMCLFSLFTGIVTGCASIVSGHQQSVSVSTQPVKGATCSLKNNKGTWYVPATPGTVVVNRSYEDLNIECEKKGYSKSHKAVSSSTKAMAFGNVLFGGVIGGAVDVASGAAYDYPQEIRIPFERA
jgi:hypothetical protein